jgi:hypothetical protein
MAEAEAGAVSSFIRRAIAGTAKPAWSDTNDQSDKDCTQP